MAGHFDPLLVVVSFAIAILASWVALEFSGRIYGQQQGARRYLWLAAGSFCMGTGIWSMHFVGMLAFRVEMPVLYDWPTVLTSLIAAVVASGVAFLMVSRERLSWTGTAVGGVVMGSGIAGMHYLGMAAMRMPMAMSYSVPLVAASVVAAVVISMTALRLTFGLRHLRTGWSRMKAGSAVLMGMAIPTMHYLGMMAAHVTSKPGRFAATDLRHAIPLAQLSPVAVVQATLLVLALALIFTDWDRRVSHFESTLHGSQRSYAQLLDHNERLQAAFRAGGVGIWECDPATAEFYVDPSLRDLYGIEREDKPVPREVWKQRVHPEDAAALDQRWAACLASENRYENEYRIRRPDGVVKRVRSVASIMRGEDGTLLRVLGMTWDVTVERRREQETADLAERFRMTLESIGDAVISTDEHQRVIFLNRAASVLTDWDLTQAVGRPLEEIFRTHAEGSGQACLNPVQRCLQKGEVSLVEDSVLRSRSGTPHHIRMHVALMNQEGAAVLTFQDVTAARRMERELQRAATHDALTGLANRAEFEKQLRAVWQATKGTERTHCLCLLDLDRFKIINDTSGHLAGDGLLREIAHLLERSLHPGDLAARMGGDEFLLLFANCSRDAGEQRLTDLLHALGKLRFPWEGRLYDTTASSGMVFLDGQSPEPEVLISQVDVATFTAKRNGRNQVSVYAGQGSGAEGDLAEMKLVAGLRRSLEENHFELYAQPIVAVESPHRATRFELLLRMRDAQGEMVPPSVFIPAAERYGLIGVVDRWVIRAAMEMYRDHCPADSEIVFSVNLSAESLSEPSLWEFVEEQLRLTGVPPRSFTFEVTETGLIGNFDHARDFVKHARAAGCQIALDDFGTGLSSLSYLKQFALDSIKIDGAFIRTLEDNLLDQAIIRSIGEIARSMNATTVAECVEDIRTLEILGRLGVDHVQGWATGRPGPLLEVLTGLQADRASEVSALQGAA